MAQRTGPNKATRHYFRSWAWRNHAACLGADTEAFFPEREVRQSTTGRPEPLALRRTSESKLVIEIFCDACPVKAECLEHALYVPERGGIWGGLTTPEREQLIKKYSKQRRMA